MQNETRIQPDFPIYDSHTHVNCEDMYPDHERYIQSFIDGWGKWMVNSWASEFYNEKTIEISAKYSNHPDVTIKSSLGRHPLECVENIITPSNMKQHMDRLVDLYSESPEHVVAIWECGIDLHYPNWNETLEIQKELFAMQCDRAQEVNLPLVIHSRDWFQPTLDVLRNYKDLTIYFHCRGYWPEEYRQLKDIFPNLYIWFCGNITYKKVDDLLETLKIVDRDRLVLETDAPYLTPQIIRWQKNEPLFVRYIYDFVSDFLQIEKNSLSQQIESNFKKLYRII